MDAPKNSLPLRHGPPHPLDVTSGLFRIFLATSLLGGCSPNELIEGEYGNFGPDHVVQIELTMMPEDWEILRNQSRDFLTEFEGECMSQPFENNYATFPATLLMDGDYVLSIGVRKKGFIGSQSTTKPSLKLNLDEYIPGAELFGTDNVTLNNAVQDRALIRQCIAYGVFADAGVHAPRCNFARVSVNGEDLGIYAHVEPVKRSFLRDHFGSDDGDLYEGTLSDFQDAWYQTFDPKTDETDETLADVIALKDAIPSDGSILDALEPLLDIDQFMTFMAMETIVGHWDGYNGSNHNNFYVYDDPATDKFVFIPWGADGVMDHRRVGDQTYAYSSISYYLLQDDEAASQFDQRARELLDEVWIEAELHAEIDRIEALLSAEIDLEPYADGIEDLRNYVSDRRAVLEDKLPGPPGELWDPGCISHVGSLDAVFETTWGSIDEIGAIDDFTQIGTLDMNMTWDGYDVPFEQSGVAAGYDDGTPLLVFAGLMDSDEGSIVVPYIYFDDEQISDGTTLSIGEDEAGGGILYTDNSMGGQMVEAGWLYGGSINFDRFDSTSGGIVSGTMTAGIYAWE